MVVNCPKCGKYAFPTRIQDLYDPDGCDWERHQPGDGAVVDSELN